MLHVRSVGRLPRTGLPSNSASSGADFARCAFSRISIAPCASMRFVVEAASSCPAPALGSQGPIQVRGPLVGVPWICSGGRQVPLGGNVCAAYNPPRSGVHAKHLAWRVCDAVVMASGQTADTKAESGPRLSGSIPRHHDFTRLCRPFAASDRLSGEPGLRRRVDDFRVRRRFANHANATPLPSSSGIVVRRRAMVRQNAGGSRCATRERGCCDANLDSRTE